MGVLRQNRKMSGFGEVLPDALRWGDDLHCTKVDGLWARATASGSASRTHTANPTDPAQADRKPTKASCSRPERS